MSEKIESNKEQLHLSIVERLKLNNLPRWVHGVGLGGTLLVLLISIILFMIFKDVAVWDQWIPADEFINPQYGEHIYPDSIFRTRMNTWSNLVYVLFGFYAIALAVHDWKAKRPLSQGYLTHAPIQSFLFGIAGIYLGLGSGLFHASLTRFGQQCDVGGMYATMICMAAIAIGSWIPYMEIPRSRRIIPTWPVIAIVVVFGSIYFSYYKWDYSFSRISAYLSGIIIVFAVVSLIQPGKYLQIRWFVAAVLSIILGSKIRDLDIQGRFTGPDAILQGHAVWHVVSCLFYVFMLLYFRSEKRLET
ncbi:MAG: ceramidase domain-containing protein [Bacteroidota bacterium]